MLSKEELIELGIHGEPLPIPDRWLDQHYPFTFHVHWRYVLAPSFDEGGLIRLLSGGDYAGLRCDMTPTKHASFDALFFSPLTERLPARLSLSDTMHLRLVDFGPFLFSHRQGFWAGYMSRQGPFAPHWSEELGRVDACWAARNWCALFDTSQEAWDACRRNDWMVWLLNEIGENDGIPGYYSIPEAERPRRIRDYFPLAPVLPADE